MEVKPKLSYRFALPLSSLLIAFSIFAFVGTPSHPKRDLVPLDSFRVIEEHGIHFLDYRIETAPLWLYQGLHAAPSIFWCISIPIQHNDALRNRFPQFHRLLGYATLITSLVQIISGVTFLFTDLAYSHHDIFHIHALKINGVWVPPFIWPTFQLGLFVYAPVFFFTLVRTLQTARARDFRRHRKWAVLHSIVGYAIAIQRANMLLVMGAGKGIALLPSRVRRDWLGMPTLEELPKVVDLEVSAFAGLTTMAYVVAAGWGFSQVKSLMT